MSTRLWIWCLAFASLAISWFSACSCGTIEAPLCEPVSQNQHPDWRAIKGIADVVSTPSESIDACLQVSWGESLQSGPTQALTWSLKYHKNKIFTQDAQGQWTQTPDISLPASADGQIFRFAVFFFDPTKTTQATAKSLCEGPIRQPRSFECLTDEQCLAGYIFAPVGFTGRLFFVKPTDINDPKEFSPQCQLLLREQAPPEDLSDSVEPTPDLERSPEPVNADTTEPTHEPDMSRVEQPVDAGPDEVIGEVSVEPDGLSDAGTDTGADAGADGGADATADTGLCEGPSMPEASPIDAPSSTPSTWASYGGGRGDNGLTAGGIGVYKRDGSIYVTGQLHLDNPLSNNQPTFFREGILSSLTPTLANRSSFLAKLDASGQWVAVSINSIGGATAEGAAIAVDQRLRTPRAIYMAGYYEPNPLSRGILYGPGVFSDPVGFEKEGIVVRYDDSGSRLSPVWAVRVGGEAADQVTSVAVDVHGDVIVAGIVQNFSYIRQPPPAVHTPGPVQIPFDDNGNMRSSVSLMLNKEFGYFLAKVSSQGKWLWARMIFEADFPTMPSDLPKTSNGFPSEPSVAVGHDNQIWVAGAFWGSHNFGGQKLLSTSAPLAAFVAKYQPRFDSTTCQEIAPSLADAIKAENSASVGFTRIGAIALENGNDNGVLKSDAYVAGRCSGSLTSVNVANAPLTQLCGDKHIFVAKVLTNSAGGKPSLFWDPVMVSGTMGQQNNEFQEVRGLAVDVGGNNIYVTGIQQGPVTFMDNAVSIVKINSPPTPPTGYGIFLAKLRFFSQGAPAQWGWEWAILGGRNATTQPDRVVRGLGVALDGNDLPILLGRMAPGATFMGRSANSATPPLSSVFVTPIPASGPP